MVPSLNLKDILTNPKLLENLTLSRVMSPEERKSKLRREEREALFSDITKAVIALFALVMVSIFIYLCLSIINTPSASPDDKKWATSLITLMASGVVGYLTGKASK
jgi:hypothetical protein